MENFEKKFIETMKDSMPSDARERFKKRFPDGGFDRFDNLEEGRIPIPVPIRVKSGSMDDNKLVVHTSSTTREINWENIELISLGVIKERLRDDVPKSQVRIMIRGLFFGESTKNRSKEAPHRLTYLLDIYIKDEESPLRIDHTVVNYRSFLNECGYSSQENFRSLARKLVEYAKNTKIDPNLVNFITRAKEGVTKYKTVYDFELECQNYRINPQKLQSGEEIEFL